VAIDRGAELDLGVVGVDNAQPLESNAALDILESLSQAVVGAPVVARGEGVGRIQTQTKSRVAAEHIEQGANLGEAGAEHVARASRVLEQDPGGASTLEHLTQSIGDVPHGLVHGLTTTRADMNDYSNQVAAFGPGGARGQGVNRAPTDARVWRGEVDQVSGMGKVGSDTSRGGRIPQPARPCRAGYPSAAAGSKHLDAPGAEIDGALDRRRESAAG
jgi:hypothetical protein